MTDKLQQEAREAAEGFVADPSFKIGKVIDRVALPYAAGWIEVGYILAAAAREKEIAELRAKLEAVPVEEMKAICEWELGLDFPCEAAATIDRWLAGLEGK